MLVANRLFYNSPLASIYNAIIDKIFGTWFIRGYFYVLWKEERLNDLTRAINAMPVNLVYLMPTVIRSLDIMRLPYLETLLLRGGDFDRFDL